MNTLTELSSTELFALAVALVAGLIIGLERGWKEREATEGSRVAGLRTFGLIGLAGGIVGVLATEHGGVVLATGLAGITALAAIGYWLDHRQDETDVSVTTAVAIPVAFGLGALATIGHAGTAAAVAVVVALLLGLKPQLHAGLRAMSRDDLLAALQLLLASVVVLPLLPNQGFGPYEALNPYKLWWLVVLVSAASFAGYAAVRAVGPHIGMLALGFLGGLVSSTAVSLALARAVRQAPAIRSAAAAGAMAATSVMAARIGIIGSLLAPELMPRIAPAATAAAVAGVAMTFIYMRRTGHAETPEKSALSNPFELRVAIQYALLVGLTIVASRAMLEWLGDAGLYTVSAIGGLLDVDAPVVAAANLTRQGIAIGTALISIALAVTVNSITKLALIAGYGDLSLAARVGIGYAVMGAAVIVAAVAAI